MLNSINPVSARYSNTPAFKGTHTLITRHEYDATHSKILGEVEKLVGAENVLISTGRDNKPTTRVGILPKVGLVEIITQNTSVDVKVMRLIKRIMKDHHGYIKSYQPSLSLFLAIISSRGRKI